VREALPATGKNDHSQHNSGFVVKVVTFSPAKPITPPFSLSAYHQHPVSARMWRMTERDTS